jgi:hypothetical protein
MKSCVKDIPWCWFSSSLLRLTTALFKAFPFLPPCLPSFLHWRWRHHIPPKHWKWYTTPHGITSQKTVAFIITVVCLVQSHVWYPVQFGATLVNLHKFERGGDKGTDSLVMS